MTQMRTIENTHPEDIRAADITEVEPERPSVFSKIKSIMCSSLRAKRPDFIV